MNGSIQPTVELATTNGANNSTGTSSITNYYLYVPKGVTLSSYFITGRYYKLIGWPCDTKNYMQFDGTQPVMYFDGTKLVPVMTQQLTLKQDLLAYGPKTGSLYRTNVGGGGGFSISGTSGEFPTVTRTGN